MSNLRLRLADSQLAAPSKVVKPFGRHLVQSGHISQADLVHGLDLQRHMDAPLGDILVSEGLVPNSDMMAALAQLHNIQLVDIDVDPAPMHLSQRLPAHLCLKHNVTPWMEMADILLVATNAPKEFEKLRSHMAPTGQLMVPVLADSAQIQREISRLYGSELAQSAASRVPEHASCRSFEVNPVIRRAWAWGVILGLILALSISPAWTFTIAILLAFATLCMATCLKGAAFVSQICSVARRPPPPAATAPNPAFRLPKVSVLVPLLKEKEIADVLIKRLERLTYPKSLLNVVLVLEQGDALTKQTIARTVLPPWITVIEVPQAGKLTTKPRALNYAMDFCVGSIIGVWDAEDAPEPDQIERVVQRFQVAPRNVACLQGILDYYNASTNWISRCFTIEYATWWRMILPGIARLGLVIPLGGTTLFFRRDILEELCGWDAHNVTEDADLGIRLARHGYVTELLDTVTLEEANCRAWPWVKQRSRWLKGFLITWCVHMRTPRRLLHDLGMMRFLGVQTLFLATFMQFACAPLLWTFWLTLFGLPHPVEITLGAPVMWGMIYVFILSELLSLTVSMIAVSGPKHRHLMAWVLTTPFYFPMGVLAAFKALHEFVVSPFYWDKTQHGITPEATSTPA